ncbi:MAG: thioredoxin family protein [bacterium]
MDGVAGGFAAEDMETFDRERFRKSVLESEIPSLVTFCAKWCKSCSLIRPVVKEISEKYEGRMHVFEVDAESSPETASEQGVLSVPTLILYVGGKAVMRLVGFSSRKDIEDKLGKELEQRV